MEKSEITQVVLQVIPDLEEDEAETLIDLVEERQAKAGTIMLSQGDRGRELYILLNGDFSVFYKARVNLMTVAMHIANISGPTMLGEVNLVLQTERTATVVARTECEYLFVDKETYEDIVLKHPRIAIKIATKIASVIQNRYEMQRRTMYQQLIKESESPAVGIARLGRWLGKWTRISDDMSTRLFKDYEGENFNS